MTHTKQDMNIITACVKAFAPSDKEMAIHGLKEAHNRLSAWADSADLWASRMNDLEAKSYRNQASNYRYCQERIEAAIQAFKS